QRRGCGLFRLQEYSPGRIGCVDDRAHCMQRGVGSSIRRPGSRRGTKKCHRLRAERRLQWVDKMLQEFPNGFRPVVAAERSNPHLRPAAES
ncbi:hypothetical protein BMJ22_34465, partial [Sinorhizobium medicae]